MSDSLHPILVDAKREYQVRLTDLMTPFLMYYINDTYAIAKEEAGSRNALMQFQSMLHAVPQWNSGIIRERTESIEKKYSFFSNLVAAVFVATIKVLSSIRISSQRPNIKLKLPSNDAFVHKVYICVARNFYENVTVMRDGDLAAKKRMICSGIEMAVRDMLPLGEVLSAYLSTAVDDNKVNPVLSPVQSDDEDAVSSIDSSSSDEETESTKIVPLDDASEGGTDFPTPVPGGRMPEMQQHAYASQQPFGQTQPPQHQPMHHVEPESAFQSDMPPNQHQTPQHPQNPQHPQHQNPQLSENPHFPNFPNDPPAYPKPPLFPDAADGDRHFR